MLPSSKLRFAEHGARNTVAIFRCPGCNDNHQVRIKSLDYPDACWTYNDKPDKPTFQPSILVTGTLPMTDEQHGLYMLYKILPTPVAYRCHSFITAGRIQFLSDCTHALASTTVDLPDLRLE
jgi:hypothetical protein